MFTRISLDDFTRLQKHESVIRSLVPLSNELGKTETEYRRPSTRPSKENYFWLHAKKWAPGKNPPRKSSRRRRVRSVSNGQFSPGGRAGTIMYVRSYGHGLREFLVTDILANFLFFIQLLDMPPTGETREPLYTIE